MRDGFVAEVLRRVPGAQLTGPQVNRHPAIASFVFPGFGGETLLLELEQRGVIVSSGSACAAGSDEPSHVLIACGYDPDIAHTSVRFSLGHNTTNEELEQTVVALESAVASLKGLS
jgi:cysteine desulfurase